MTEFDEMGIAVGKHHWTPEKWVTAIERFRNLIGLQSDTELTEFKVLVLVSSTKFSKKTPKQFCRFRQQIVGPYRNLFVRGNTADMLAFLDDHVGRFFWRRFKKTKAFADLLTDMSPEEYAIFVKINEST